MAQPAKRALDKVPLSTVEESSIMPKVTFLPVNQTCEAQIGESILDVAIQHDIPLQHACGGFCACTTCHVHVEAHAEHLSAMEEHEQERIAAVDRLAANSRLGCQAKVQGDVTVTIMNIDEGY